MTPTLLVWEFLGVVGFVFLFVTLCACVRAVTLRPSKLAEQTAPSSLKGQKKKVGDLFIYTLDLKEQIEEASPERKVILEEYLKVAEMKEEQERVKLDAMQVEADRELFERMMDK